MSMATEEDCPTGILVDLSDADHQEMSFASQVFQTPIGVYNDKSKVPGICYSNADKLKGLNGPFKGPASSPQQTEDVGTSPTLVPYPRFEKHIIESSEALLQKQVPKANTSLDECDVRLLEDEVLDYQDSSSPSSDLSEYDTISEMSNDWSSTGSSTACMSTLNGNLSIQEIVEVFKEATTVALHLQNYGREVPVDNSSSPPMTPFLKRPLHTGLVSQTRVDAMDVDWASDLENKQPPSCNVDNATNVGSSMKQKNGTEGTNNCTLTSISKVLRSNRIKSAAPKSPAFSKGPMKATVLVPSNGASKSSQTSNHSDVGASRRKTMFNKLQIVDRASSRLKNSAVSGFNSAPRKILSTPCTPALQVRERPTPSSTMSSSAVMSSLPCVTPKRTMSIVESKTTKPYTRRSIEVMQCITPLCPAPAKSAISSAAPSRRRSAGLTRLQTPTKISTSHPTPVTAVKRSNSIGSQLKRPLDPVLFARGKTLPRPQKPFKL